VARYGCSGQDRHDAGSASRTVPGPNDQWGLTITSAEQQRILLDNLISARSPLTRASRHYAMSLMQSVDSDQRWGVPVVADKGTTAAVKDGWLAVADDGDLWTVNSVGVVTVHGHTVLVAVMTQHEDSYSSGIARVETLAAATVAAVQR